MFTSRLNTLKRVMRTIEKNNALYKEAESKLSQQHAQIRFLETFQYQIKALDLAITDNESKWRESVLSILESEIISALESVYPTDGYIVKLNTRVLRGKIHIEASVKSTFSDIPGRIQGTQGRLFQQIVSFAALIAVMNLLGVKTVYIDESFSGSSKRNVAKLNTLLDAIASRGFNLVIIAQDSAMASGIQANRIILSRSTDNKTSIQEG